MDTVLPKRPVAGLSLLVLFGFLVFTLAVGFLAGQLTAPNIAGWYSGLAKPSFNPPNGVFAPVWTGLYAVMAVAAWRVWRAKGFRSPVLGLWLVQLGLNFAWTFIFFGAHAPGPALAELALLWGAIFVTLVGFGRIDKPAGWLMIPYLLWVSFAGILNYWVWQLNP